MTEYDAMLANSDLLYSFEDINQALDLLASQLTQDYAEKHPLVLCVMNGAVMTTGHLMSRLLFRLELDYIHASRYGDKTVGGELRWQAKPHSDLQGRHVLLIEDIFDEGLTLSALRDYCLQAGAASVRCVCLFNKQRSDKVGSMPEYIGLDVPNRYVFGFGMDVEGDWRNLPAVYALREA